MEDAGEVKRYYKWNSGSLKDKAEVYLCDDEQYTWFESGTCILKDQLEVQLDIIDESEYLANAPKDEIFNQYESMLTGEVPLGSPATIAPVIEKSPIRIILDKQKKMQSEGIDISMEVKIPSIKVVEFMAMMFDEDEIIEEICEFVKSQINQDDIDDAIKNAIISKFNVLDLPSEE